MNINNIKDFDKIISSYANIERNLIRSTTMLCMEENKDIRFERLNDLKTSILENLQSIDSNELHVEVTDSIRLVNETFTFINKARRSNSDFEVFESLLVNLTVNIINKRKNLSISDSIYESYNNNIQYVYDVEQTILQEELSCYLDSLIGEYDDNVSFMNNGLLESVVTKTVEFLNKIKSSFGVKHDKIVQRDGDWLKTNKKALEKFKYNGVELEVPSDINVSFAKLINRYDTFDKNFKKAVGDYDTFYDSIKRFEDKNGNLKNGLDNYLKTGNSRREVNMKKVSDVEAKNAVTEMISYCEEFLSGKGYIDNKLSSILLELDSEENTEEVAKESYGIFSILREADANVDTDEDKTDAKSVEVDAENADGKGVKEEEPSKKDEEEDTPVDDTAKILRDRQTGITVLMTIAEERYFDYIDILKSLLSDTEEEEE